MPDQRITDLTQSHVILVDDMIEKDGPTGTSLKISPFDAHGQFRNALALSAGLAFDGTAGSGFTITLTNNNFATDPFAIEFGIRVPSSTSAISTAMFLFGLTSSLTTVDAARGFSADFEATNGGALRLSLRGAATTDYIINDFYNVVTNYAGKLLRVAIVRPASGDPLVFFNGVQQTKSATVTGGTPPTWQDTCTSTYLIFGRFNASTYPFAGLLVRLSLYNLELAASDVLEIFELNGAVPERYKWGTEVPLSTYTSDFSAGVSGWQADAPNVITGSTDGINGQDHWLKCDSGTGPTALSPKRYMNPTAPRAYRIAARLYNPVASTITYLTWWTNNSASANLGTPIAIGADQQVDYVETIRNVTGSYSGFQASNAAGARISSLVSQTVYLKNYTVTQVGAIAHFTLDDRLGYQLQDASTNRLHALMTTTGVSHVIPSDGPVPVRYITDGTTTAQKLCGGTTIPANSKVLQVLARAQSGTPNFILGTGSGGSQVVASVALSTTWKDCTVALTGGILSSATDLWTTISAANAVEILVFWEPLKP